MISFEPKQQPSIIKVLGVGGGGSNAVNHMFKQGIKGVDFIVCNTDVQALDASPVPIKVVLGDNGGLGAGSKPNVGKGAASESLDKMRDALMGDTQMLFITAGMGGGTGTGAAPIIAELAREMGILTVGIVTLPFSWEGRKRTLQAMAGIEEIKKYVDTLLIISNDKLREQYGNLTVSEAFAKADNVLTSAAKGIAELITVTGYVNIDFEDVKTVIEDSGKAIMGSATAEGENRALTAIEDAMSSPLLNDNDIKGAKDILLYIMTGTDDITMDEITEITEYVQQESGNEADIIWGNGKDETLGIQIGITIIATGFESKKRVEEKPKQTVIGTIGEGNASENTVAPPKAPEKTEEKEDSISEIKRVEKPVADFSPTASATPTEERKVFKLEETETKETAEEEPSEPISLIKRTTDSHLSIQHTISSNTSEEQLKEAEHTEDKEIEKNAADRVNKLKNLSMNLRTPGMVNELESQPAYVRKKVTLEEPKHSSESAVSRYTLGEDSKGQSVIKSDNSFLHDNVD